MPYFYDSLYFDDPFVAGRAMDIFMPDEVKSPVSLFFVHGGGWGAGSRGGYHTLMQEFKKHGFVCASTDYRLTGQGGRILDQVTDVRRGYDLFTSFLKEKNLPNDIFVIGSSAGDHLGALFSWSKPGECGEKNELDNPWKPPVGVSLHAPGLTFEPWEDIFPQIWDSMQAAAGVSFDDDPELYKKISPVEYLSEDTCPTFFLLAENEHIFPNEFAIEIAERMKGLGVRAEWKVYDKVEHGFFYSLSRRQQKEAFADVLNFVKSI